MKSLVDIGDAFMSTLTHGTKSVLDEIARRVCEITEADCAVIYPYDPIRGEFYDIEAIGHHGLLLPKVPSDKPRRRGLGAHVVKSGELVFGDIEAEDPDVMKEPLHPARASQGLHGHPAGRGG